MSILTRIRAIRMLITSKGCYTSEGRQPHPILGVEREGFLKEVTFPLKPKKQELARQCGESKKNGCQRS